MPFLLPTMRSVGNKGFHRPWHGGVLFADTRRQQSITVLLKDNLLNNYTLILPRCVFTFL